MISIEDIRQVLNQLEHEAVTHLNEWAAEHPEDGSGGEEAERGAQVFRDAAARAFASGKGTWRVLAMDRLMEAFANETPTGLRDALLDAAGLLVAWVVDLDGRKGLEWPQAPARGLQRRSGGG